MIKEGGRKFFYGYVIVAACSIISFLYLGVYRSFGIFFEPMSSDLGWTSAMTSGAYSLSYLLFGFLGIIAGRLTDKLGPKIVLVTAGLFFGLGYLLMSQVSSVWQLYLFYGVIVGAGMSGADTPVLSTIARWFTKRRGLATGITKAGAGVGLFAMPLVANWLISSYGWRSAFAVIGIISVIGFVSAALFLKRDPGQIGQLPDGVTEVEANDSITTSPQLSLREVIVTRQFWILASVWFLLAFGLQVVFIHTVPHIIKIGISASTAAAVLGTSGAVSIFGRLIMGSISDRLGSKVTFIIALLFLTAALVSIQFAQEAWLFYLFAALFGIAHGAFFTLVSPMLAELFGLRSLGVTIGAVIFIGTIGGSISPVLSGRIFDITGSYQLAFLISLILSIIAVILMLFLKPIDNAILRKIH